MFDWKMGVFWISGGVLLWLAWKNKGLVFRFLSRFYGLGAIIIFILLTIELSHSVYVSGFSDGWDNFATIFTNKAVAKSNVKQAAVAPALQLSAEEQAIVDETDYMYSLEKTNEDYFYHFEFVFSPDYDVPNDLNTGIIYLDVTNFSSTPIKYIEMTCVALEDGKVRKNPIGIFKDILHPVVDDMSQLGMLYPGKTQTYSLNRHIITWIDWANKTEGTVDTIPSIGSITCVKIGIQLASS